MATRRHLGAVGEVRGEIVGMPSSDESGATVGGGKSVEGNIRNDVWQRYLEVLLTYTLALILLEQEDNHE